MSDRTARNEREKQDRKDLAEFREIIADPKTLREYMGKMKRTEDFVNSLGSRNKPYFKKEELPK